MLQNRTLLISLTLLIFFTLAAGGSFSFLEAQGIPEENPSNPFSSPPTEIPPDIQFSQEKPEDAGIDEETLPVPVPRKRQWVEVPDKTGKRYIEADDFRDPYFMIRGFNEDARQALHPGTTVDGIRFNTYSDSNPSVEKIYRESNFSMDDVFGKINYLERRDGCFFCHQGIEEISSNHRFSCIRCHGGNRSAKTLSGAHKGLVSNPSDLDHAPKYCGKCHEDQIEKVKTSPMTTAAGIINTTRYTWGAQPADELPHSLLPGKDQQPLSGPGEGHPVDGFLRTKCLRCHVQGPAPHRPGDYRATGCASCHMIYTNDGLSLTHDRAIQNLQTEERNKKINRFQRKYAARSLKNPRGYPVVHKFTTAVPSIQCEHCHNANGTGSEFEGLFQKPPRPKPALQTVDAEKPLLHGRDHEFLLPDIHRERGMHCIDCHGLEDLKGKPKSSQNPGVQVRCEDCHGTHANYPDEMLLLLSDPDHKQLLKSISQNPKLRKKISNGDLILVNSFGRPLPHIKHEKKQWILISKVTGKEHKIPVLKDLSVPVAHQVQGHMNKMECHTCHARWTAAEWGYHVIRETQPEPAQWRDWSFSDPTTMQWLSYSNLPPGSMKTLDWTTAKRDAGGIQGEWLPGTWWSIITESGWADMILGKNQRGKYSILKPRYQYFFTDRPTSQGPPAKRALVLMTRDGQPGFMMQPYSPHTIRKTIRRCESCHEESIAMGLGDTKKSIIELAEKFLVKLKLYNRVPLEFQLKQMVTTKGRPLQTTPPGEMIRFLNAEEIALLKQKSNRYRALRHLDLRRKGYSRLLIREEFPYDLQHKKKEHEAGLPRREEKLYYSLDTNVFTESNPFITRIPEPQKPASPPTDFAEPFGPRFEEEASEEGGQIIEFFRNLLPENQP